MISKDIFMVNDIGYLSLYLELLVLTVVPVIKERKWNICCWTRFYNLISTSFISIWERLSHMTEFTYRKKGGRGGGILGVALTWHGGLVRSGFWLTNPPELTRFTGKESETVLLSLFKWPALLARDFSRLILNSTGWWWWWWWCRCSVNV